MVNVNSYISDSLKMIECRIEGLSPVLQHRFPDEENGKTGPTNKKRGTPREQAETVEYRTPEGVLYLPGTSIARMTRESGANHKQKSTRKSVKWIVPAAMIVLDDVLEYEDPATGEPITEYEVDSRPVVIPSTKGRIMRHRPRIERWATTVRLQIDESVLDEELIHQLIAEGGIRQGVGDYRPSSGGPFGRFRVTGWKEVELN